MQTIMMAFAGTKQHMQNFIPMLLKKMKQTSPIQAMFRWCDKIVSKQLCSSFLKKPQYLSEWEMASHDQNFLAISSKF